MNIKGMHMAEVTEQAEILRYQVSLVTDIDRHWNWN